MADLPFERGEYRDRARRVREEMVRRGVDVLYVMSPANILYLSGFESIWYPPRAPLGVVLRRDDERLTFLDYGRHETLVAMTAHYDDAVFFEYTDAVETVVGAFRANGWTDGTVGIERYTRSPAGPLVERMAGALADAGAEIVPGDWIVDRVRLVKSPAELERVRGASGIVDSAFEALHDYLRPGRTELQVSAFLTLAMADLGGEEASLRPMVSAGPEVWCRTHATPTRRPLERGDVVFVDACGVVDRYHVDVCRTFALGDDNPGARAILEHTTQSVEHVVRGVRPGDPLDVAQRIAEEHVFARYGPEQVWWIGGYALGISLPPDWVGHTYLSNDAYEQFTWEPGYVTNYENIVFDREAGFTASYMETLLMTETGIEILSRVPRTLQVVELS